MVRRMSYEIGGPGNAKPYTVDFYKLRNDLLQDRTLFEDTEFPPIDSSLYYSKLPVRNFQWRRPGEISKNPKFFEEDVSRFDIQQGELGDCWLASSLANLTLNQQLFYKVVPRDQSFYMNYAGIFHFRFWRFGRWVDVVIDDKLPTLDGQLVFLRSSTQNEFWSALLEKAYAKVHGSYEALKGGHASEAMVDFTGGVCEIYNLHEDIPNLFKIMLKAYERKSLIECSTTPDPFTTEARTSQGLILGHSYSVTRVISVNIKTLNITDKIALVRIRNPWGNKIEWNGPWSDDSPEWQTISQEEKNKIGLVFDFDGEFWMSFDDFKTHFETVNICYLSPDTLIDVVFEKSTQEWETRVFEDKWIRNITAGGCDMYYDTFWRNPQYRVTLLDADVDDDENKCTMLVSLMQENRRALKREGLDFLYIGFSIYYLPDPSTLPTPLNANFFKRNAAVARSPTYTNRRQITGRFSLSPGTYCIVPSTFEPNEEAEFLLRIFFEHNVNVEKSYATKQNNDNEENGESNRSKTSITSIDNVSPSFIEEVQKKFVAVILLIISTLFIFAFLIFK